MSSNQLLYTLKEACDALFAEGYNEASRKRVRRWIKSGVFNAVMDGSRYYIPKSEIDSLGETKCENQESLGQRSKRPRTQNG
tara:strand:+ start:272 stop:517 length:246 start_codon:yes stop_codon:yes gene_type:complete